MDDKTKEIILEKLTEILIKQDCEDKKKGKVTYVKKTDFCKGLIKFFKEMKE